ncbi:MAG: HDOD domain-containing protein [Pseudomonadota bacterium]
MQESNLNKIIHFEKQLYQHHLPVLNNTLRMVEEKLSREQFNYEQLESLFSIDPMCLFNFLTCANQYTQNFSSDFEETIKTPKHASMLLGIDNIEKCIAKLTTLNNIETPVIAYKLEQLACRSLHCAYQARNMARLINDKAEDEVFLSALMMSLTELLVWFISPRQAQQYEFLIYTQSITEVDAQFKVFGFSFLDLIIHMEPKWRLPELYLDALKIETLDGAKKSIKCIKLADKLSRLVDFGWYYQDVYEHIDYCASIIPFSAQRLAKEFHHVAVQMSNDMIGFYKYSLPLNALLLEPIKIPYYPVLLLRKKEKQKKSGISKQTKNRNVKAQILSAKADSNFENVSNLPTLIKITINTLFQSENFDQVLFLMLDKSKNDMTIYIEETKLKNSVMQKKIAISSPDKNLFKLLLEKPQPIFVELSNTERYNHLVTKQMTDILPAREFFAKAFYYKNKPIGIFYVANTNVPLDTDKFSFFNKTLVSFENHLSRLN